MKLSFFPFTPDIETVVRHQELLGSDTVCSVISFREDLARLREFERRTGVPCTASIETGLTQAEALLLLNNDFGLRWDKYFSCIDYASTCNIPIYASRDLIAQIPDDARKTRLIQMENVHALQLRYADRRLFEIKTPIVVVMGMGENCGKFECQLELKELLDAQGYHSEWLCSNSLGSHMGMKSLPEFLFDSALSFPEKVYEFNRYVYDFCAASDPDLLVIGVPSGITPIAEKDTNYFAEIPLVVSAALRVDYGILAFYYRMDVHDDFLERLTRYCLHRFQIRVPVLYMSRQMLARDQEGSKMRQLFLSDVYIAEHKSNLSLECHVAAPLKNNVPVFDSLIACLRENLETV